MSSYSKHRKRGKKRSKRRPVPRRGGGGCNCHHLAWQRATWCNGYAKRLREHHYCKVMIPANTLHKYIHENMRGVSLPKELSCRYAYEQIELMYDMGVIGDKDTIERRLSLLASLFDVIDQRTADDFRRQLFIVQDWRDSS